MSEVAKEPREQIRWEQRGRDQNGEESKKAGSKSAMGSKRAREQNGEERICVSKSDGSKTAVAK